MKPNREKLRQLMLENRLNSKHVSELLYVSHGRVRTFASATGDDISNVQLELLEFKVGAMKNAN